MISIVVCAEEKCHLVHHETQDYFEEAQKMITCDVDIHFNLEYHQKPYNEPYKMDVVCDDPASRFYNLLPFLNVSNFESVEELWVTNCELPELYSMLQENFPKLRCLDLVEISLPKKFFNIETKLEEISVSEVKEIEIENLSLFRMPELKKIALTGIENNLFPLVLKKDALADMPHLTHVLVYRCSIKMLPETLFTNSTNIRQIDFFNNDITHIPNTLFTNFTELQTIDIRGNKITSIDL